MTIGFVFKGVKNDGTAQLYVRFKDGKLRSINSDRRIKVEGVFIDQTFWDKNLKKVTDKHPNSIFINKKISKYEKKMLEVKNMYQANKIDFNEAVSHLQTEKSSESILEFIRTKFSIYKKGTHLKNCIDTVITVTEHLGLKELYFEDITEINFIRLRNILLDKGRSPHTYNTYLRNIKTICNLAVKKKFIDHDFGFDSSWKARVSPMPNVRTSDPKEIRYAIDNITIKAESIRSFQTTLREFETVALWLLMFSLRGFYPADIHKLTSNNLDYDFLKRIKAFQKGYHDEVIIGNPNIYLHQRHKTRYPMNIFISLPPIRQLISFLRTLVSITHPSISYLNGVETSIPIAQWAKTAKEDDIDFLKIFSITKDKNQKAFSTTWRLYRKKAKDIGLPPFEVARKTFMTLSDELENSRAIGRTLLGHKDPSISANYTDLKRPKILGLVTKAHISILQEFHVIDLHNHLMKKFFNLFPNMKNEFFYIDDDPSILYQAYNNVIDRLIGRRDKIDPMLF